jgi:hypothetical protein
LAAIEASREGRTVDVVAMVEGARE